MRLRIATATLASLLLLIPLAACNDGGSDEPESTASDTSSSTPSTSPSSEDPSPTDTGPTIPPDAQGTDEASAKAFVRFYFETLSDAMESGDTDGLRQLSTKRCKTCANFANLIDETYGEGGSYETRGWRVRTIVPGTLMPGGTWEFYLGTIEHARNLFASDGHLVDAKKRAEVAMRILVGSKDHSWIIVGLEVIQ